MLLSLRSALDVLSSDFTDLILNDQDCFCEEEKWEELLRLLPDREIVRRLEDKWSRDKTRSSELKWADIKAEIKGLEKGSSQRVWHC
jgi:DNA primase small subunit